MPRLASLSVSPVSRLLGAALLATGCGTDVTVTLSGEVSVATGEVAGLGPASQGSPCEAVFVYNIGMHDLEDLDRRHGAYSLAEPGALTVSVGDTTIEGSRTALFEVSAPRKQTHRLLVSDGTEPGRLGTEPTETRPMEIDGEPQRGLSFTALFTGTAATRLDDDRPPSPFPYAHKRHWSTFDLRDADGDTITCQLREVVAVETEG